MLGKAVRARQGSSKAARRAGCQGLSPPHQQKETGDVERFASSKPPVYNGVRFPLGLASTSHQACYNAHDVANASLVSARDWAVTASLSQ